MNQHLPSVSSPKLISERADRLAFNFRGNKYILPDLTKPSLFNPKFEIGVFVKKFLADNQGRLGRKVITDEVLDEALKEFAIQGFPGSSK